MNKFLPRVEKNLRLNQLTENPILYAVISIFLVMYGPRLQPKLPDSLRDLFNNNIVRFLVILLITYTSSKNMQIALLLSIAFSLLTSMSTTQEMYLDFGKLTNLLKKIPVDKIKKNIEKNEKKLDINSEINLPDSLMNNTTDSIKEQQSYVKDLDSLPKWNEDESSKMNAQVACKDGLDSKDCINYCYSMAGFRDEFCQKHFPNPQVDCLDEEDMDKKIACLKNNCNLDANKVKTFCRFSETMNEMDQITKNILADVNQYKNPLGE